MGTSSVVVIDRSLLKSKAFIELSAIGFKVLCLFYARRQFAKIRRNWVISNNGEIIFTYTEAKDKYKISRSRFQRALDDLIKYGFIDIKHHDMQSRKDTKTGELKRLQSEFVQETRESWGLKKSSIWVSIE